VTCAQVKEVLKNQLDHVVKWRVKWYSASAGSLAGTERGTFRSLTGKQSEDLLDVDEETLVASAKCLVESNKKLPAATVKDAKRVLLAAVQAEDNGLVRCCHCEEEDATQQLVACECCSQVYHVGCATGYTEGQEWWCPSCK
jgi:hypothetical protein